MTTTQAPICLSCIYFHEKETYGFTCKAFPEGIPDEIMLFSTVDHREEVDGDKGIVFKQNPARPKADFSVFEKS